MDFKQTVKNIPPMRWVTYAICAAMFFVMIGITIYQAAANILEENIFVMIGNVLIWLVPFAARPVFKDHVGDGVYLFFAVYVFFASFLGTVMRFYVNIWWYDLLIHTLFGYVGCVVGLFAACKLCDIKKISPAFAAVFCVAFSMMLAALWEIMEYLGDQWLGNDAQGNSHWVDGILMRNVKDTMEDIICHTCGSIVFALHYIAHVLSKKSLLLDALKADFSKGKKQRPAPAEEQAGTSAQPIADCRAEGSESAAKPVPAPQTTAAAAAAPKENLPAEAADETVNCAAETQTEE